MWQNLVRLSLLGDRHVPPLEVGAERLDFLQFVENLTRRPRGCGLAFPAEFVGREFNFRAFLRHRRIAIGVAGGGNGRRRELPSGSCRSGVTR